MSLRMPVQKLSFAWPKYLSLWFFLTVAPISLFFFGALSSVAQNLKNFFSFGPYVAMHRQVLGKDVVCVGLLACARGCGACRVFWAPRTAWTCTVGQLTTTVQDPRAVLRGSG